MSINMIKNLALKEQSRNLIRKRALGGALNTKRYFNYSQITQSMRINDRGETNEKLNK